MKKNLRWWLRCLVHNCVVHPLLPAAEVLDSIGAHRAAKVVFDAHDATVPDGGD